MPPVLSARDLRGEVEMAENRFVLQDDVIDFVYDLILSDAALLASSLEILRLPAQTLWLEWCQPEKDDRCRTKLEAEPRDAGSARRTPPRSPCTEPLHGTGGSRRSSRLHYVRGHLVRRGDAIFWRRPHLRGHSVGGQPYNPARRISL